MIVQCDLELLELEISLREMELFKILTLPWSATNSSETLEETYCQNSKKSIQRAALEARLSESTVCHILYFKVLTIPRLVYTLIENDPDQRVQLYIHFFFKHCIFKLLITMVEFNLSEVC